MATIDIREMGQRAKAAGRRLAQSPTERRNAVLHEIARLLESVGDELWEANEADLTEARRIFHSLETLSRTEAMQEWLKRTK